MKKSKLNKASLTFLFILFLFYTGYTQSISFSPNTGVVGTSFGVTVTGSGTLFDASSTTTVRILASPTTINLTNIMVSSSSTLTADINIPMSHTPGTYNGQVFFGSGGQTYNCTNCFTITTPIPVELLSFLGFLKDNGKVRLLWSTASEISSDYFEIQRSTDGRNWQSIGKVNAAGFSSGRIDYQYEDERPMSGNNYYRLRQVDFNGEVEWSELVEVSVLSPAMSVQLFPNPTNGELNISMFSELEVEMEIEISDISGQLVQRISGKSLSKGSNTISLDLRASVREYTY